MSKKFDKEFKQQQQIAAGLATLKQARQSVDDLAARYDEWIDQAAELGEDEYSDQLIADQVELEEFSRNLSFFEIRITEGAVSAQAFSQLKTLPGVLDCCRGLLKQGLDLPKIGKQMAGFKASLDKARTSLKDLRSELSAKDTTVDLFGRPVKEDPKIASKIAAKKQAREARLAARLASESVTPVAAETVAGASAGASTSAGSTTDIDAITAMIDEERKKK